MINSIAPATLTAAPLLWAGLAKIARTPTSRLAVGYQLAPRSACSRRYLALVNVSRTGSNRQAALLASSARHGRWVITTNLGAAWQLERFIAGGIVGETLPLANLRCEAEACIALGGLVDVQV